jgi:hypothetical protein
MPIDIISVTTVHAQSLKKQGNKAVMGAIL